MKRWLCIAAMSLLLAGFMWQCAVADSQAEQIEELGREVMELRRVQDFWPSLVRTEFRRFELSLQGWMEDMRDGSESERGE